MKRSLFLSVTAVVLAFAATSRSQADPYQYSYNWTANPTDISAGNGGVSFTSNDSGTTTQETDVPATNVSVFSAASTANPDVISTPASGSNYTLSVTLTDSNGSGSGAVTFTGLLQGKLTYDSSNLTNAITGVTDETGSHPGQTFGIAMVDGSMYVVSYDGFAAPGPEAQHNQGAISFHIAFEPGFNDGPSSPEPSSLVLGCLGLTILGGVVCRARRRKADLLNVAV